MFYYTRYSLLLLTAIGFFGCTPPQQTISVNTSNRPIVAPPIRGPRPAPVQEEVVVTPQPTPSQTVVRDNRVDVPHNNPTLDVRETTATVVRRSGVDQLNGEVMERMPFPEEEYRHLKKIGHSTVSGRIYLLNSENDQEIKGRKVKLYLNPVTSYSRQWYEESYLGGYKMSPVDKRLYNYLHYTSSDDQGRFDFYGVPQGDYYIIGSIACGKACGLNQEEKIRLVKEVHVGSGVTKVDLMKHVP